MLTVSYGYANDSITEEEFQAAAKEMSRLFDEITQTPNRTTEMVRMSFAAQILASSKDLNVVVRYTAEVTDHEYGELYLQEMRWRASRLTALLN
jgi:hypothetical protein